MEYVLTAAKQLLMLLMLTILFKGYFPLRYSRNFFGGTALFFALAQTVLACLLPAYAALICLVVLNAWYLHCLFEGGWQKLLLYLCGFLIIYLIVFSGSTWLFARSVLMSLPLTPPEDFLVTLFAQLYMYGLNSILEGFRKRNGYPFTYYFPLVPLLLTLGMLIGWHNNDTTLSKQTLYVALSLVILFDYTALAFQGWLLASLNTRRKVHEEQLRREILKNKYQILQKQYEESFGFLHQLLRQCANLQPWLDEHSDPDLKAQIREIASSAFVQFNSVCMSPPTLSALLDEKKSQYEQEHIYVSTALQSDHFGLMTAKEQRLLFGSLLDYIEEQIHQLSLPVNTIAMRSWASANEIYLSILFPCLPSPLQAKGFERLQKKLSRSFRAAVSLTCDQQNQARLTLAMPLAYQDLMEELK